MDPMEAVKTTYNNIASIISGVMYRIYYKALSLLQAPIAMNVVDPMQQRNVVYC